MSSVINVTQLEDAVVPELFSQYTNEESIKTNAFFQSGVIQLTDTLSPLTERGRTVHLPFWTDLEGRSQVLDSHTDLNVAKLESGDDIAAIIGRALVYGATDLATDLAGSDPMASLVQRYATKWSSELNLTLIAVLQGATGLLASDGVNTLDISGLSGDAAKIDGDSFIDAEQVLGDMKIRIAAVAMHSAVESTLRKRDQIEFVPESQGGDGIPRYKGKRVIVDDDLAPESGSLYTTYLFGEGAVGWAEGSPKIPSEVFREPLKNGGQEYLISRRLFIMHPRGIAWTPHAGVPVKDTPSDIEMEQSNNWSRVYQPKNIRIVRFIHKL